MRPTNPARRLAAIAAASMCALGTPRLAAQPAATVAVDDPVYDLVDELLARVPVRAIVGQRPYSRRELARLARSIAAHRGSGASPRTERLLAALVAFVGDTATADALATRTSASGFRALPLEAATIGAAANAVAPRAILANGLGGIDAETAPPLDARGARPVVHGLATSLETSHVLGTGGVALLARPRLTVLTPTAGDPRVTIVPQRLVARGVWHDVALQAGADAMTWGQGGARSLLLSDNAAPLRAITLGTDTAVTLPWLLRVVGPVRATAVVADLGRGQNFPHAKLAGYAVSFAPSTRFEIGTGILSQYGGHGAPPLDFGQRVADLFPYVTWIHPGTSRSRDKLASNKIAGVNARLRVPALHALSVYWDGEIDDFEPRRLPRLLWEDGSHLLGARLDDLGPDGAFALDVQLRHTSLRVFEHAQFTSGVTYRRAVLGDPLGPNAGGASATLAWRRDVATHVALRTTYERRDPSRYVTTADDSLDTNFRFERVESRPVERRARLELLAGHDAPRGVSPSLRVGVDRVTNENFVARAARWRPFAEAGATWKP